MSKKNVQLFIEKIQADKVLQKKFLCCYEGDRNNIHANVVKMGIEAGYEFNELDLQQTIEEMISGNQSEKLDETSIELVRGNQEAWNTLTAINYTACLYTAVHHCNPQDRLMNIKNMIR